MLKCTHVHVSLASGACVLIPLVVYSFYHWRSFLKFLTIATLSLVKRDWIEIQ